MKNIVALSMSILMTVLLSCQKEITPTPGDNNNPIVKKTIRGFAQKGPFEMGTSITIIELDSMLAQSGRNFNTQITSNDGNFKIQNILLNNDIVEIKADGFYFNEVTGTTSENKLTLYALSDLKDSSTVNVNVLSYLEKARIEYLVESGKGFAEAKKQAQQEVLAIFEVEKQDIVQSEHLDISKSGEDNAILLAISVILQGKRNVAGLSELLAKISNDIRVDGTLDDPDIGSQLINDAKVINLAAIKSNMVDKYIGLGKTDTIPDFESKIANFIDKTDFVFNLAIKYPREGKYGISILSLEEGEVIASPAHYSLKALLPAGFNLKVTVKQTSEVGEDWFYATSFGGEVSPYELGHNSLGNMSWTTKENVTDADNRISFVGRGIGVIEIYENNAATPTKTIHFKWDAPKNFGLGYPVDGKFGKNIFALDDQTTLVRGQTYSLKMILPTNLSPDLAVTVVRTNGTGTISVNSKLAENWSAGVSEDKSSLYANCVLQPPYADMPIVFNGTGECTLELKVVNAGNTSVLLKHFKW